MDNGCQKAASSVGVVGYGRRRGNRSRPRCHITSCSDHTNQKENPKEREIEVLRWEFEYESRNVSDLDKSESVGDKETLGQMIDSGDP